MMFNWFRWGKIMYGTSHVWLDCPIVFSTISVESYPFMWKKPLWIYAGKCCHRYYMSFVFGWLRRMVTFQFIGGVSSSDIDKLKEEILVKLAKQN